MVEPIASRNLLVAALGTVCSGGCLEERLFPLKNFGCSIKKALILVTCC